MGDLKLTPYGMKAMKQLRELNHLEVFVGFQAGQNTAKRRVEGKKQLEDTGVDILNVAVWNEFGTSTIPARPFIMQTWDKRRAEIYKFTQAIATRVIEGKAAAKESANQLGAKVKSMIQQTIRDGEFVPNAPSTIKKKGSSNPLIDTGTMRQSVTYVVRKKGSGGSWSSGVTIE